MKRTALVWLAAGLLAIGLAVAIFAATASLWIPGALAAAGRAYGFVVEVKRTSVSLHHATLDELSVRNVAGEPVLWAPHLELTYDLRDLLPGGRRLYGLVSLRADNPQLTILRHRDGSYNVPVPKQVGPSKPGAPLDADIQVKNGSVTYHDDTRRYPEARTFEVVEINADARIHPHADSRYVVSAGVLAPGGRSKIFGKGRFDPDAEAGFQQWTSPRIAVAPVINFGLDSAALRVLGGELRDVTVVIGDLRARDGSMHRYVFGSGLLHGVSMHIAGMTAPITGAHGRILASSDTLLVPLVRANLAGTTISVAGGVYDFTHPKLQVGIRAEGSTARVLATLPAAHAVRVGGGFSLQAHVEGDAGKPLALAAVKGSNVLLDALALHGVSARVGVLGDMATVLSAQAGYATISGSAWGNIRIGARSDLELLAAVNGSSNDVPYLGRLAPNVPLRAVAVLGGKANAPNATGIVGGSSSRTSFSSLFAIAADGTGSIGPLTLDDRSGASLYARAIRARRGGDLAIVAFAQNLRLAPVSDRRLPGLALPELPPIGATLNLAFAGSLHGTMPAYGAGTIGVKDLTFGGVTVEDARASAIASNAVVTFPSLSARGPWGRLDASGTASGSQVALAGRLRGDLATVRTLAGGPPASGIADVGVRAVGNAQRMLVQTSDARLTDVTVAGVGLRNFSGTFAVSPNRVQVYAVQADVEGGRVAAYGDSATDLRVSVGDVPAHALRRFGVPLESGTLSAAVDVRGPMNEPDVRGVAALVGSGIAHVPVSATTRLAYSRGALNVGDATALAAGAVVQADGSVTGITGAAGGVRYRMDAHVRGFDLSTASRVAKLHYPLAGGADADLRVGGAGTAPTIAGTATVAAGEVNGLYFHDANAQVNVRAGSVDVPSARAAVGSSWIFASGGAGASTLRASLRAPSVDLSDFNGFFDPGDMLAGRGFVGLGFARSGASVQSHGAVVLSGARYSRYALGDLRADWSSERNAVRARADVAAQSGRLALRAVARVPASDPLRAPLTRIPIDGSVVATGIDLGTWLPSAGIFVPVGGALDANVTLSGPLALASAHASGAVHGATVRGIAVQSATFDGRMQRGRVVASSAEAHIPQLALTAGGAFGLRSSDPFDVHAAATSPDIGELAKALTGKTFGAKGALSATAELKGTRARPDARAAVDVTQPQWSGITAKAVRLQAGVSNALATLDRAEIDFQRGAVLATAHVPLDPRTHRIAAAAPVTGSVELASFDLAQLTPLLPKDSALGGTLAGRLALSGTAHAPLTSGEFSLSGGAYASPLLRSPLQNVSAQLVMSGPSAQLTALSATLGGGTISGSGSAAIGDLTDPIRSLSADARLRVAGAKIDSPQYVRGTLDADVTIARRAAGPFNVGGTVSVPYARVPLSALYRPAPATSTPQPVPDVAFALQMVVGNDVRVQSGQVDVGAQGRLHLGGTLAEPTLAGTLTATSGSVDFYRSFQIQSARARFLPENGVIPMVEAVATTRIADPPTYVTLTVGGLATSLNVVLASDPAYSRSQILGLLVGVQQLGAVSGVAPTAGNVGVGQLAQSFVETTVAQQFTRQLLEPLSAQFGKAFGLSQFAINYTPMGGFETSARKGLAKNLDGVWGTTFNYPVRQSLGIEWHPRPATSVTFSYFTQQGTGSLSPLYYSTAIGPQAVSAGNNLGLLAAQPAAGTSGVTFLFQRRFWGVRSRRRAVPAGPSPSPAPETATR